MYCDIAKKYYDISHSPKDIHFISKEDSSQVIYQIPVFPLAAILEFQFLYTVSKTNNLIVICSFTSNTEHKPLPHTPT